MLTNELCAELLSRLQNGVDVNMLGSRELHALSDAIEIILINRMAESHAAMDETIHYVYD